MSFVKPLDDVTPSDLPLVGGKAYNCARLKQAGFPVPDGVAVSSEAKTSAASFDELHGWLEGLPKEALFAVRSSAADEDSAGHSFAGLHETKLNVSPDGIDGAVRACWASMESPQALAYRRAVGLPTDYLRTGLLVQRMVQPVVSGVAFTANPVTGAQDELVITASWGLGEALVGGYVEPDEFHVRKSDTAILSVHLGSKRYRVASERGVSRLIETVEHERAKSSLTEEQVRELSALLLRVEKHFNAPQDVEWCYDGEKFWVLQSRPVTGTARPPAEIEWTRANLREVLPDLASPQVLSVVEHMLNRGMRKYYGQLLAPERELGPMAKVFFGRSYFNLSQFRHVSKLSGTPTASFLRAIGHQAEIKPDDEVTSFPALREFLRALPDMFRLAWLQVRVGALLRRELAGIQEELDYLARLDLERFSSELANEMWDERPTEHLQVVLALGGVVLYESTLRKICEKVGFPYERLLHAYVAAGEKSVSAQQAFDLLRLANQARGEERVRNYFLNDPQGFEKFREDLRATEFLKEFEAFLDHYGHRGIYESDWALPRYSEDPSPLLFAIREHVQAPECPTPESLRTDQDRHARDVWDEFKAKLSGWQRLTRALPARWLLRKIKQRYMWRELLRSEMVRAGSAARRWQLRLAERFVQRGWIEQPQDHFFLTLEEAARGLREADFAGTFRTLVAQRKAQYAFWRQLEMPALMREYELPVLMRRAMASRPETEVTALRGLCVSPGYAEGEVAVIRAPTEFARMKRGAILVAPATDPAWTPLFTLASGLIVEVGGTLSHASTVAREYGLPALANLKDATKLFRDGDHVQLDATNGVVRLITRPRAAN